MFAFLYLKANFTEICEKKIWLPQFFFADSNSPLKDLFFPRGPNLAQKPLYLVAPSLKAIFFSIPELYQLVVFLITQLKDVYS